VGVLESFCGKAKPPVMIPAIEMIDPSHPDWATIASLATAGGTLVLAIATFSSIRSSNRSARVAERALLVGQRPVLIPSRDDDLDELVRFGDGVILHLSGHGCALEVHDEQLYMAIALRNGGSGLAVIHSWQVQVTEQMAGATVPDVSGFRRQLRDLFIPAGYSGFWQGAIRDPADPAYAEIRAAAEPDSGQRVSVDLLYGDHEGGQRAVARFGISAGIEDETAGRADVVRYWNIDGDDPRHGD
jgi:hypothetical protein